MKKIILSITLIMSLLITSCSTSGGTASSEISETTTAITTTTEETTTTEATTTQPKQAVCSLTDLCDFMTSALGKNIDESCAFMEDALGTSFIFTKTDRHDPDGDIYKVTNYTSYFECDIVADGYHIETIFWDYGEDKLVDSISFMYLNPNSAELKNTYEYIKAVFSSSFGAPSFDFDDTDHDMSDAFYGPINDITYLISYSYFGEDNPNTGVFVGVYYKI